MANSKKIPDPISTLPIKDRRNIECFSIIDNRSVLWYNKLTKEQWQELEEWYQAWLDAPETHIIPEKPKWLK